MPDIQYRGHPGYSKAEWAGSPRAKPKDLAVELELVQWQVANYTKELMSAQVNKEMKDESFQEARHLK